MLGSDISGWYECHEALSGARRIFIFRLAFRLLASLKKSTAWCQFDRKQEKKKHSEWDAGWHVGNKETEIRLGIRTPPHSAQDSTLDYHTTNLMSHQVRSSTAMQSPAATSLFRRLVWEGTVPIEIKIDSKELPAGSDRGLECYYVCTTTSTVKTFVHC